MSAGGAGVQHCITRVHKHGLPFRYVDSAERLRGKAPETHVIRKEEPALLETSPVRQIATPRELADRAPNKEQIKCEARHSCRRRLRLECAGLPGGCPAP